MLSLLNRVYADSPMPFSAVILAGGRSLRMGHPKAMLPFAGASILERLVIELQHECNDVIIVAAPALCETYAIEEALRESAKKITLVRDAVAFGGPADALMRGLRAARQEVVFACSCDLPMLRAEVARELCALIADYDAAIPEIDGKLQPLCAAYGRRCIPAISTMVAQGERRLTAIVTRLNARRIGEAELRQFDPELRSFLNLNTPADYAHALRLAR
jgi:molybdopterin-guanine dinucleotide biosynthesis protein A